MVSDICRTEIGMRVAEQALDKVRLGHGTQWSIRESVFDDDTCRKCSQRLRCKQQRRTSVVPAVYIHMYLYSSTYSNHVKDYASRQTTLAQNKPQTVSIYVVGRCCLNDNLLKSIQVQHKPAGSQCFPRGILSTSCPCCTTA